MRLLVLVVVLCASPLYGGELGTTIDPMREYRYCADKPARDAEGRIARRNDVLRAFRQAHPCPATGKSTGRCDGWAIDHVIPLACGGCDAVSNLQWLPWRLKGSKEGKDRFERLIYCRPMRAVPAD